MNLKLIIAIMLVAVMATPAMATVVIPHGTTRADGDSFTLAVSGNNRNYDNTFLNRFARYYDLDLTNAGVGGSKAGDALVKIYDEVPVPTPYNTHVINIGYNDIRNYWATTETINATATRISSIVAFLRTGAILKSTNESIVYSGAWYGGAPTHDIYSSMIKMTNTSGSTATIQTEGNLIQLGLLYYATPSAAFTVTVDNEVRYTRTAEDYQCVTNDAYCAAAIEIPTTSGTHEVVIQNTGGKFAIDWVGYGNREDTPVIVVNGYTTKLNASAPTAAANVIANQKLQETLSMFDEKVIYCGQEDFDVNINMAIGPGTDIVHPNNFGHALIFQSMRDAI